MSDFTKKITNFVYLRRDLNSAKTVNIRVVEGDQIPDTGELGTIFETSLDALNYARSWTKYLIKCKIDVGENKFRYRLFSDLLKEEKKRLKGK